MNERDMVREEITNEFKFESHLSRCHAHAIIDAILALGPLTAARVHQSAQRKLISLNRIKLMDLNKAQYELEKTVEMFNPKQHFNHDDC